MDAPDQRKEGRIEHSMNSIIWACLSGLITNQMTLRDVEALLESMSPLFRQNVPKPISDTTLDTELRRMDVAYLMDKLALQIREQHRDKNLKPFGFPCGIATVDGKNRGYAWT